MSELRKHYLLNEWVLFAPIRAKRPKLIEMRSEEKTLDENCPFCPGNEWMTPKASDFWPEEKNWQIRVFQNKYPAVTMEVEQFENKEPFERETVFGIHEVIVETREHNKTLAMLTTGQIFEVLKMYRKRFIELSEKNGIKEVLLFKNHGKEAGASIKHAHAQIIAISRLSERTKAELKEFKKYTNIYNACPYCRLIEIEKKSKRFVLENENWLCIAPFASKVQYELMLIPKIHVKSIAELNDSYLSTLAEVLKPILGAVEKLTENYNMYFKCSLVEDFHMYISIMPKLSKLAGFEFSSGIIINTCLPEDAAKTYRELLGVSHDS